MACCQAELRQAAPNIHSGTLKNHIADIDDNLFDQ